jgi:hypothetical protein
LISYDAVKIFMPAGAKAPIYTPYVEHVPPDVTACIFWLKNRRPQDWRDVQQMEHVLGKYIMSDKPMTEEQWIRERATGALSGRRACLRSGSAPSQPPHQARQTIDHIAERIATNSCVPVDIRDAHAVGK